MRERPILMSAPMVRAIMAGTKTQTRRAWKMPRGCGWYSEMGGEQAGWFVDHGQPWWLHVNESRCPYGHPGDRLWVREAWRAMAIFDNRPPRDLGVPVAYIADESAGALPGFGRYRHARFMPRWASRITLEISDVRVERLCEISEADAVAEGLEWRDECWATYDADGRMVCGGSPDPREAYRCLWININGPGSWDANPWVWALTFRRIGDA